MCFGAKKVRLIKHLVLKKLVGKVFRCFLELLMKFLFIFYRVKVYDSTLARNTVVGKNQVVVFFVVDALEHKGAEEKCVSALKLCCIVLLGKDSKRNQGGGALPALPPLEDFSGFFISIIILYFL